VKRQITGQKNSYNYLVCNISFDSDTDINNTIAKYQGICGAIKRILNTKVIKDTQLKVLAVAFLLYGSGVLNFEKNG
jgi:hypothetical protein